MAEYPTGENTIAEWMGRHGIDGSPESIVKAMEENPSVLCDLETDIDNACTDAHHICRNSMMESGWIPPNPSKQWRPSMEYVVLTKDLNNRTIEADSFRITPNGYLVFHKHSLDANGKITKTDYIVIAPGRYCECMPKSLLEG